MPGLGGDIARHDPKLAVGRSAVHGAAKRGGSETDTTRGGRNWWAVNDVCLARTDWAYDHCNDDDYNHNPPNGTSYRNDLTNNAGDSFALYSSL